MADNSLLHEALGSATASIISRTFTHPLDTVKARLQAPIPAHSPTAGTRITTTTAAYYSGPADVFRRTLRVEGIGGFYRGFGAVIVGGTPGTMAYLCGYEYFKGRLSSYVGIGGDRGGATSTSESENGTGSSASYREFLVHFMSGMLAETIVCVIYVPVDVVKERMQVQQHNRPLGTIDERGSNYRGSYDALRTIMRTEGLRGIYKGYWATLGSFGPFSALYFVFYEQMKRWARSNLAARRSLEEKGSFGSNPTGVGSPQVIDDHDDISRSTVMTEDIPFPYLMACSAGAGALASFLTSPLDMAKLRLQVQRGRQAAAATNATAASASMSMAVDGTNCVGVLDCLKRAYRESGLRGLFRGAGARVLHFTPSTCITMTCYEKCRLFYASFLAGENR